jgi:hypothetical protein
LDGISYFICLKASNLSDHMPLSPSLLSLSHTEWYLHEGGVVLTPPSVALAAPQMPPPTHLFLSFGEMFQ